MKHLFKLFLACLVALALSGCGDDLGSKHSHDSAAPEACDCECPCCEDGHDGEAGHECPEGCECDCECCHGKDEATSGGEGGRDHGGSGGEGGCSGGSCGRPD